MEPRITIVTLGVKDLQRSYDFYCRGLKFPTNSDIKDGILFIQTQGTRLALYPFEKLEEDIGIEFPQQHTGFRGITFAHNTKKRQDVDAVLQLAQQSGGTIEKAAQDVFWGGYSGYFSDPDGYLWEVAYADSFQFNEDGSLVI
ncbi:VOC family protein [Candidatus Uabimicrobium sp. HlEnr_7]|uniref:VOC family protein n=1 Tax=Candidatus Uabimicrobium helgolandensis TaxID=3095367 RepID=UPI00355816E3